MSVQLAQNLNLDLAQDNLKTETHFLGTYTLRELTLTLKNGTIIDLGQVFSEMEVFEDIFKYSIEGKIKISDYVGGQEKFIITGGEKISFVALKPNGMNEILISRRDLIVTKFSDITVAQGNGRSYDLFFSSESTINSVKKKLFKSYGNDRNLYSVVKKIYSDMGNPEENLLISETSSVPLNAPFVSSGYNPLEAINMLAKRSCVNEDYFLFFERFNSRPQEKYKHIFVGINELKKYWENLNKIPKIVYEPKTGLVNYVGSTETDDIVMANYIKIEPNFDHITNIVTGFYNSRIRSLDLINRTYTDTKLEYLKETDDLVYDVYKNKFLDANSIFATFDDTTIERLIVAPKNDAVQNKSKWLKFDTYGGVLNTSIRVTVKISGGSNYIGVGSLVELNLPSDVSKTFNLENPIPHEDQVYSGKYIVTAVRHTVSQKTYEKVLELSRGSLRFNIDELVERNQV
jgi:hypothetical protein